MTSNGFESLLIAQITSAWTMFESFSGSLWENALNAHPRILAELKGKPKNRIHKLAMINAGAIDAKEKNETVQSKINTDIDSERVVGISGLHSISNGSYDLGNKMGTLLRDRFSFPTLDGIRETYSVIMGADDDKLDKLFANNILDAVSIIRNVISHHAGVADKEYIYKSKKMKYMNGILPRVEVGEKVTINGELAKNLVPPLVELAVKILETTDSWIVTQKKVWESRNAK